MGETYTVFNEYTVTNAHEKWKGAQESEKLGCTGSLETETEMRTVKKMCEGEEVLSEDIPVKMKGKLTLHMPVEIARKVYGLKTDGLKKGVYAYGTGSRQGAGAMTFDVIDLYEEMKKLLAFPNMNFSGGYKWSLENGKDEIAEIEVEFNALKDDNKKFYYEAIESEVTDQTVIEQWHTNFTPELVTATTP